jgi:hypothetical protein
MKCGGKAIVYLAVCLAWTLSCRAVIGESGDGPYRAIVDRNIFDLKPIPPPPPPAEAPAAPPPNVKLIGLMLISGHPQGIFSVQDPTPGKPPTNYVLGEDQRQAALEVKTIDYAGKKATVQIGGDISELKLDETPAATASAGPAPGRGFDPGQRGFIPGVRGGMPGVRGGMPGGRGGMPGGMGGAGAPGYAPMGGYNSAALSASYNPGLSPGVGGGNLASQQVANGNADQPSLTPEEQVLNFEALREQYKNQGDVRLPLIPPTQLTPAMEASDSANQPTTGATGNPTGNSGPPSLPSALQPRTTGNYALPGQ